MNKFNFFLILILIGGVGYLGYEVAQQKNAIEAANADISALNTSVSSMDYQVAQLAARIDAADNDIDSLEASILSANKEMDDLIASVDKNIEDLNNLHLALASETELRESGDSLLSAAQTQMLSTISGLNAQITQMSTEITGRYQEIAMQYADLSDKYEELSSRPVATQTNINNSEISKKIDTLTSTMNSKFQEVNNKYNTLANQYNALVSKYTDINNKYTELQDQMSHISSDPTIISTLYEKVYRSVVRIEATGNYESWTGSGVFISTDGYIATSAHVVRNQVSMKVYFYNGVYTSADLISFDTSKDVAIIKINDKLEYSQPAQMGAVNTVKPGQISVLIGYPISDSSYLQGKPTVTTGVLSGVRTSGRINYLQISNAANNDDDGGPIFDLDGKVIGLYKAAIVNNGLSTENLHIAMPIDYAAELYGRARSQQ